MRSIKRLSKSVHNTVRSSIVLFDLPRVVEELVYNSIDAGSTKVDISINVRACYVKVADGGCGITRDGLVILGEKYATSKLKSTAEIESSNSNMGFKGETIGSLSDISLVEIRTKARGWPNAYCKIIKGSKCIFLGIDDQREAVGTTVTVRELFYNQPVRRKCMQSSPKKVLHSVKKCMLQIALVHPQISFRVTDTESEEELLCTVASSSPLPLISSGFGLETSSSLHEIVYSDELYTLSGFISGPSDTSTKALQYLYINSRFVSKGAIHNSINNLANRFQIQTDQIIRDEYFSKPQSRKRTKYDRCPSFLLNLSCPLSSYDLSFEPSKTIVEFKDLNIVLSFFERAVTKFWKGLPRDPLKETCCVEDSASLSLERESLKQEGDKSLASRRKRKSQSQSQTTHYPSSTLKNTAQEINDDILYETPPRNSHANSFSLNRCKNEVSSSFTSNTNNHDWLDNEYVSPNIRPKNSRNYEKTSFTFEDNKPFMKSCSRERNCFLEDEYPKREHFSDFEKIGGEFCNFQNSFNVDNNMYLHEKSTEWNFPETSRNDFTSTEKDWVFNSPRKKSRDMKKIESFGFGYSKLMENEDEIFESNEDLNIFSEIPTVNHRKSKAFECSNSEFNTGFHFLDSLITKKNSEFQFLDSPITKKNSELQFLDSPIAKKNSNFQFPDSPIAKKISDFQFPDSPIAKKNSEFQFLDSPITKKNSEFQFPGSPIIKINSEFHFPDSPIAKKNPDFPFLDSPIAKKNSEFQFPDSPITKNSSEFQLQDSPVIKRSDGLSLKSPFDESKLRKYPFDKVRVRSRSAPPFHKGKSKFSALNECLTALTGQNPSFHVAKNSPVEMHLSQLCCKKPPSSETPELNFREKSKEETKCQDEFDRTEAELTKWRADPIQPSTVFSLNNNNSTEDILSISSGLLSLSSDSNSLIPQSIEREILEDARVLLQIDKKFIPVIAKDTLIILDQHAADERIRLEDLRRKVLSGEGCGVTNLASEQELVLPEMGFLLLEKYNEHIKKWGWITSNDIKSSDPFTKNMSVLKKHVSAITLVAVPCIIGTNLTSKDLVEFLEQLVETDGSANIPPSVIRILNSKACRGAIMFGDPLLPSECSLILEELKATSLCFQCAHGRPTTVPILNIKRLHDELAKIEMQNDTWRGLRHNKLSLERAKTRLDQAKM